MAKVLRWTGYVLGALLLIVLIAAAPAVLVIAMFCGGMFTWKLFVPTVFTAAAPTVFVKAIFAAGTFNE